MSEGSMYGEPDPYKHTGTGIKGEIGIFFCWLGGHAIIRKDHYRMVLLCRCGLKSVTDEVLWRRYKR